MPVLIQTVKSKLSQYKTFFICNAVLSLAIGLAVAEPMEERRMKVNFFNCASVHDSCTHQSGADSTPAIKSAVDATTEAHRHGQ